MIGRWVRFLTRDIWKMDLRQLRGPRAFFFRYLRILVLSVRGFLKDECQLRASALTFYTLLSVVPVVALVLAIAKGFGLYEVLMRQLGDSGGWQGSVSHAVMRFAASLLEQSRGGLVAGIGTVVLIWSVVSVLASIEETFNRIREIRTGRTPIRQFTDYFSMVLVGTVLFVTASSLTVAVTSGVRAVAAHVPLLGTAGPVILFLLKLVPYVIMWLLFTFLYVFMPNGKVSVVSGLTAGIIAGTVFQVVQWAYIAFQIGVSSYSAVYGSLAALPLFLAWLQISWYILLFGAELSFAAENSATYGYDPDYTKLSHNDLRLVALRIMRLLVRDFARGAPPPAAPEIAATLALPLRLVHRLLNELTDARLVNAAAGEKSGEDTYQPSRDTDAFTLRSVIDALDAHRAAAAPATTAPDAEALALRMKECRELLERSPVNSKLGEIRAGAE